MIPAETRATQQAARRTVITHAHDPHDVNTQQRIAR